MSRLPTYRAYLVEPAPERSEVKARWIEVGAAWAHRNGQGFDLIIPAGMSVTGRVVCIPPKDAEAR